MILVIAEEKKFFVFVLCLILFLFYFLNFCFRLQVSSIWCDNGKAAFWNWFGMIYSYVWQNLNLLHLIKRAYISTEISRWYTNIISSSKNDIMRNQKCGAIWRRLWLGKLLQLISISRIESISNKILKELIKLYYRYTTFLQKHMTDLLIIALFVIDFIVQN